MFVRSPRREVKKKNGLSSVDGAMFSGKESKNAASALPDSNVEVTASKATSGPSNILNPCAWSLRARLLPLRIGEGVGTRDDRYDVADVQRDNMMTELGGRHALALQARWLRSRPGDRIRRGDCLGLYQRDTDSSPPGFSAR